MIKKITKFTHTNDLHKWKIKTILRYILFSAIVQLWVCLIIELINTSKSSTLLGTDQLPYVDFPQILLILSFDIFTTIFSMNQILTDLNVFHTQPEVIIEEFTASINAIT